MINFLSFGKHKKKEEHEDFSDIFPELNQLKQEITSGPNFEQNLGSNTLPLPNPIEKSVTNLPLPTYSQQSIQTQQPVQQATYLPEPPPKEPVRMEEKQLPVSEPVRERIDYNLFEEKEEKPEIYIRIDKYKELLSLLDRLNRKLKDIENDLIELKNLKSKELDRLDLSRKELEESKESIDRVLSILKGF